MLDPSAARFSDPRIAIDRNVRQTAIRRGNHFMSGRATFRNGCDLLARLRIDDAQRLITLVGDEQNPARCRVEVACLTRLRVPESEAI